jgi:hypothetical protein
VIVGSRGAIVPLRRPAPEGGGAAAPASSRAHCCAQKEWETGWGYCSQFKGEAGKLEDEEDATTAELGNGGGSGGSPVWSRLGSTGSGDENLQQSELDEPLVNPRRKREGRRRLSFTGGDEFTTAAAGTRGDDAGDLVLERVRWCAERAKGGAGVRARA